MKVKIQQRKVYQKFAEVEIEIDNNDFERWRYEKEKYYAECGDYDMIDLINIKDYLIIKEDLFKEKINQAINKAKYVIDDSRSDNEWKYEIENDNETMHIL
tara:strand:- start:1421 stop:1723 length:303 start_codon:yes stop_codon:yes gene_type:complete